MVVTTVIRYVYIYTVMIVMLIFHHRSFKERRTVSLNYQ